MRDIFNNYFKISFASSIFISPGTIKVFKEISSTLSSGAELSDVFSSVM